MTTDLGGASAAGHGETWDGSGGDLSRMRRSEFLSDLLVGYLPRFPTRDALPTADATQWKRIVIVSTGAVPDVFYICLITGIGPTVYSWVDLSTAYVPPAPPPAGLISAAPAAATTEAASASSTQGDLVTISGLSIADDVNIEIHVPYRKSAGAAALVSLGLKVNSTIVEEAGNIAATGSTNVAASGLAIIRLGPRQANYLGAVSFKCDATDGFSTAANFAQTALMPAAVITSLAIRNWSGNAAVTLGVKNVRVYTYP